jgi:hypothetical protein
MVFWMVHAEAIKEVILLLSVHLFWFRGALSKIEETNPLRNFSKDLEINSALECINSQSLHPKNTFQYLILLNQFHMYISIIYVRSYSFKKNQISFVVDVKKHVSYMKDAFQNKWSI